MAFEKMLKGSERVSQVKIWGQGGVSSRGTSKCKGPETCPKKSKKASMIRMNQEKGTVVGRT